MGRVATLVHNKKSVICSANRDYIEAFHQNLTIKESFLTGPKLKVTVTSIFIIFLMSPNSN